MAGISKYYRTKLFKKSTYKKCSPLVSLTFERPPPSILLANAVYEYPLMRTVHSCNKFPEF